jgi:2-polyprenyl-3-methyl-5-hydroxy-6-metoxy-1,4-benzoquinol methylase
MRFTGERVVPDDMRDGVPNYQRHLLRYVFALEHAANRRVLDAACGTGYGAALLSTVAARVLGLDVSPDAIEYARRRFPGDLYPLCRFEQADLDVADIGSECWDTIVSLETIEHLRHPETFLERVTLALVPGGTLVASLPTHSPSEYHLHVYDGGLARALIEGSGLEILTMLGQDELSLTPVASGDAPYLVFVCRKRG